MHVHRLVQQQRWAMECRYLQISADICRYLQISADICRYLRRYLVTPLHTSRYRPQ
jgi:hypothetical protein